jgi:hypothetical protein
MKKLMVLVAIATLLVAGTAFAARPALKAAPNATFAFGAPTTTNNDDSCDIGVAPAATLLLPYFEVDIKSSATTARTTIFSITNTSALPQIAHVVVWTDWSFPALDFNIFLTGYDVQPINLYDVLARGIIAPGSTGGATGSGTSIATPVPTNPTAGSQPAANTANANFSLTNPPSKTCAAGSLPGVIPAPLLADVQSILTTGKASGAGIATCAGTQVGGVHANAIGYITIDVANTCSTSLPIQFTYFSSEILFDNVLIGDYQDVNPNPATGNYAGGNPLVHIRAIPEGGPNTGLTSVVPTNLPFTFYDRYTANTLGFPRTVDRRQPLPVAFAARYIQGGTGNFNTNYKIWREGLTGSSAACSAYASNSNIGIAEIVRFDEHENATVQGSGVIISPPPPGAPGLPETSSTPTSSSVFPPTFSGTSDLGGWMYLNLNNGGSAVYSAQRSGFTTGAVAPARTQSQNWVIISMFAEGRYSVDFDAAWLGNGCSPAPALTSAGGVIGPAGGVLVCPVGDAACTPGVGQYTGTNATP